MKPIAIFLAEKLEDIVSNENWLLVNNAADELRRLQAKVDQLEAASKPLTDDELRNVLRNTNHMIRNAMYGPFWPELEQACRAIEAAHGITPTNKGE